jgi:hypothetical protein
MEEADFKLTVKFPDCVTAPITTFDDNHHDHRGTVSQ